jgi:hypothetical protein
MALAPIDFPNDPAYGESFVATNGITYTWLGDRWRTNVGNVDINVDPSDILFNTLFDVNVPGPNQDDIVYWNNQNSMWEAKALSEWLPSFGSLVYSDQNTNITGEWNFVTDPLLDLTQLHDVTVTDPQIGDTIKWSGSSGGWVNGPACGEEGGSGSGPSITTLAELDDVELGNPSTGEVLKYVSGKWRNRVDEVGGGDGGDPIDLGPYTRRDTAETVTKGWDFALEPGEVLRVLKSGGDNDGSFSYLSPQGKLVLDGGSEGLISNTAITFLNDLTRQQAWPFETKIQLTKVPVVKSDEYDDIIGLACIGGGMTFQENDTDPLGLINITPRGLDIKRVEFEPGNYKYGSIDWKITDNLTSADPTFDVRMRMENINIGGPVDNIDNEPGLAVIGNGMIIAEKQEDVAEFPDKYGHVFVTPKFIDITRGDKRPRIRFSDRDPGAGYYAKPAFAEILGDGTGNLVIKCDEGELILRDQNGSISPSNIASTVATLQQRLAAAEARLAALEGGN